jgi:polysaccharide biosynthesis protein VpsQ
LKLLKAGASVSKTMARLILRFLPIGYISLIWLQSSYFNPESIQYLSTEINIKFLMFVGIGFELVHFFQFGILHILIITAILSFRVLTKKIEYFSMIFSLLYGLIDEIHQIYVPFRSFSYSDLIKDTVGVFLISVIVHKSYYSDKKSKVGSFLRKIGNLALKDKS